MQDKVSNLLQRISAIIVAENAICVLDNTTASFHVDRCRKNREMIKYLSEQKTELMGEMYGGVEQLCKAQLVFERPKSDE